MGMLRQRQPQQLLRLRPLILFAALLLPLVATVRDGLIATERRDDAVAGQRVGIGESGAGFATRVACGRGAMGALTVRAALPAVKAARLTRLARLTLSSLQGGADRNGVTTKGSSTQDDAAPAPPGLEYPQMAALHSLPALFSANATRRAGSSAARDDAAASKQRAVNRAPRDRTWVTRAASVHAVDGAPSTAAHAPLLTGVDSPEAALFAGAHALAEKQHALLQELEPAVVAEQGGTVPVAKDTAYLLEVVSLGWAAEHGRKRAPVGSLPPAAFGAAPAAALTQEQADAEARFIENGASDEPLLVPRGSRETSDEPTSVEPVALADVSATARARDAVYRLPLNGVQREADSPQPKPAASEPRRLQEEDSADDLILALADSSSMPLTTSAVDGHVFDVKALADAMGGPALMLDVPEDDEERSTADPEVALAAAGAAAASRRSERAHLEAAELPAVSLAIPAAMLQVSSMPADSSDDETPKEPTDPQAAPTSFAAWGEAQVAAPETIPFEQGPTVHDAPQLQSVQLPMPPPAVAESEPSLLAPLPILPNMETNPPVHSVAAARPRSDSDLLEDLPPLLALNIPAFTDPAAAESNQQSPAGTDLPMGESWGVTELPEPVVITPNSDFDVAELGRVEEFLQPKVMQTEVLAQLPGSETKVVELEIPYVKLPDIKPPEAKMPEVLLPFSDNGELEAMEAKVSAPIGSFSSATSLTGGVQGVMDFLRPAVAVAPLTAIDPVDLPAVEWGNSDGVRPYSDFVGANGQVTAAYEPYGAPTMLAESDFSSPAQQRASKRKWDGPPTMLGGAQAGFPMGLPLFTDAGSMPQVSFASSVTSLQNLHAPDNKLYFPTLEGEAQLPEALGDIVAASFHAIRSLPASSFSSLADIPDIAMPDVPGLVDVPATAQVPEMMHAPVMASVGSFASFGSIPILGRATIPPLDFADQSLKVAVLPEVTPELMHPVLALTSMAGSMMSVVGSFAADRVDVPPLLVDMFDSDKLKPALMPQLTVDQGTSSMPSSMAGSMPSSMANMPKEYKVDGFDNAAPLLWPMLEDLPAITTSLAMTSLGSLPVTSLAGATKRRELNPAAARGKAAGAGGLRQPATKPGTTGVGDGFGSAAGTDDELFLRTNGFNTGFSDLPLDGGGDAVKVFGGTPVGALGLGPLPNMRNIGVGGTSLAGSFGVSMTSSYVAPAVVQMAPLASMVSLLSTVSLPPSPPAPPASPPAPPSPPRPPFAPGTSYYQIQEAVSIAFDASSLAAQVPGISLAIPTLSPVNLPPFPSPPPPAPPSPPPPALPPGGLPCLPLFSQRWSAVTCNGDAVIGAHNLGGGIAINGALTDPASSPIGNPVPINQSPSWVHTFATGTSTANYHWHAASNSPTVGNGIPVDCGNIQALVNAMVIGTYGPTDQSGHSVHVVNQGGTYLGSGESSYHMHQFLDPTSQAYDQGRTLVVFQGCGTVRLTSVPGSVQAAYDVVGDRQGTFVGFQWGPSVLAPCAHVIVDDNAGFVDGYLVSRSLSANSANLQLHGTNFAGAGSCVSQPRPPPSPPPPLPPAPIAGFRPPPPAEPPSPPSPLPPSALPCQHFVP